MHGLKYISKHTLQVQFDSADAGRQLGDRNRTVVIAKP
jgi:hypothetical protein